MKRYFGFARTSAILLGLLAAAWLAGHGSRRILTSAHLAAGDDDADTELSLSLEQGEPARSEAYKLIDGPYEVGEVGTLVLRDAQRKKELRVRLEFPLGQGPFPVIIFSHGAGGSKDCCTELTRHWASYGYVTLQPTHMDSISLRRPQGEKAGPNGGLRGGVARALDDPAVWASRARDVSFLLDLLDEVERRVPALQDKLDATRIGVGGHSLGAYTAQLIGGATVDLPEGKGKSFADARVRAILVLSGQGRGQQGLTAQSWQNLTRPMMTMTGSLDRGASGQGPEWKKDPFDLSPPGDKYHVYLAGASHMSFTGPRAM